MFEKFKNFIGISELEYDDEIEAGQRDEKKNERNFSKNQYDTSIKKEYGSSRQVAENKDEVLIVRPSVYEDCAKIVDDLKNERTVIMNLEELENPLKNQIFEFVKGAVYALDANMQKASEDILVISPKNIKVTGKLKIRVNKNIF